VNGASEWEGPRLAAPEHRQHADPERRRLTDAHEGRAAWRRWGPYLSDRQWGTVREDYSADGDAWAYLPHDHARSRAYRWGEDGLLGISDDQGRLNFAIALWNGEDPILKERLFGLTGPEGNHGEDVKEIYAHLDATPTGSYLKALYRYPQRAFPYADLVAGSAARNRTVPEYELADTGILDEDRFFDVAVEYAKADVDDIVIRISATNRGPDASPLHILPTLWYRNTWSWGRHPSAPAISVAEVQSGRATLLASHLRMGNYRLDIDGSPELLFTDNETNAERLFGSPNASGHVKDAFHAFVVAGRRDAVNPARRGTKAAARFPLTIRPGETRTLRLRLSRARNDEPFQDADEVLAARMSEADAFFAPLADGLTPDEALVQRRAFAGLIWTKQLYNFDVAEWLAGDPAGPPPPPSRAGGRNAGWRELNSQDVLSMPDSWEYPWFASWDLAFHMLPMALVDPQFAKDQLVLLTREWFLHPNGQLPAYEWNFSDVNPPVHAWAAWRVYKIDRRINGRADHAFLERVFHKLLLNFTWWVNRKDADGHNVFQGGFLGLDNIGVFDRSASLPVPGHLGQADGTAWMGMYSLNMLAIALELARENRVYEDVATKFFEHFLYIAGALNGVEIDSTPLWDEGDEFFYDVLHLDSGPFIPLKVRSLVGLMPLLAVETLEPEVLDALPEFKRRMGWFLRNRPELASLVPSWEEPGVGRRRLLALVHGRRMKALLARALDPNEFLSDHGIRSISAWHRDHPFVLRLGGQDHVVDYEPAESRTPAFGGNSNWRGPVWWPINYLLIEALQKFDHYYGMDFQVPLPSGSDQLRSMGQVADELGRRLESLFLRDAAGRRPFRGANAGSQPEGGPDDLVLFHEYFDGDTGRGLGASHQTGWTALVAKLLEQRARRRRQTGESTPVPETTPDPTADELVVGR
jgi:mannosylglycerate hydrolase MGH1-like protein